MFDFTSFLTPEMVAMLLMFLSAMQGADGTSWLIKLVKALANMVNIPVTKRDGAFALPPNLMPILLIAGVVMFMMMSGGGCGGCALPISSEVKADVQEKPAPVIDLGGDLGELHLSAIPAGAASGPSADTGSSGAGGAGESIGQVADAGDNAVDAAGHGELVYNPGRGSASAGPNTSSAKASCAGGVCRPPRAVPRLFRRRS